MKVLKSTVSFKLYFVAFLISAFLFMFNMTSCGLTRYKTSYGTHHVAGVNKVNNIHARGY